MEGKRVQTDWRQKHLVVRCTAYTQPLPHFSGSLPSLWSFAQRSRASPVAPSLEFPHSRPLTLHTQPHPHLRTQTLPDSLNLVIPHTPRASLIVITRHHRTRSAIECSIVALLVPAHSTALPLPCTHAAMRSSAHMLHADLDF